MCIIREPELEVEPLSQGYQERRVYCVHTRRVEKKWSWGTPSPGRKKPEPEYVPAGEKDPASFIFDVGNS